MIRSDTNWYRLGLALRAEGLFERAHSFYNTMVLNAIQTEEEIRSLKREDDRMEDLLETMFYIVSPERFKKYQERKDKEDAEREYTQLGPEHADPAVMDWIASGAWGPAVERAMGVR